MPFYSVLEVDYFSWLLNLSQVDVTNLMNLLSERCGPWASCFLKIFFSLQGFRTYNPLHLCILSLNYTASANKRCESSHQEKMKGFRSPEIRMKVELALRPKLKERERERERERESNSNPVLIIYSESYIVSTMSGLLLL